MAIPNGMSFTRAEEFVVNNVSWIEKHLLQMRLDEYEHQKNKEDFIPLNRQETVQARRFLTNRLYELAQQNGFSFNKVFIRNQTTLWGSCSAKNNINLNLKLIRLPQHLRDYVILHELVHTKLKNHSWKFWADLAKYISNPKSISKELRKCGLIDRV